MINKYQSYLSTIGSYMNKYFEQQKPYIYCKEGCSICCESGLYPVSDLEFEYIKIGLEKADEKTKSVISKHIADIKKSQKENEYYKCPLLINNKCSIYEYRPLVCRSYGLLQFIEGENNKIGYYIPCCVSNGLNYASVYDEQTQSISSEKYSKLNIETEPLSFNVSVKYLLNNEFTQDLEFGKVTNLIDRFD